MVVSNPEDSRGVRRPQAFTRFESVRSAQPTRTATTVRVQNGEVTTTDGSFAETKEQLGGYFLIEAKDLNQAIQVAAKIPSARFGSVEVRPVWT